MSESGESAFSRTFGSIMGTFAGLSMVGGCLLFLVGGGFFVMILFCCLGLSGGHN